jgi:hypothetical protein
MNEAVLEGLVTGFEPLIEGLDLPDLDDRHVLAAAIQARANVIVAYNLHDFPADKLQPFRIEPQHPDEFIVGQFERSPIIACEAIKLLRARLRNPPSTAEEYLNTLQRQGLPQVVQRLRQNIVAI